MLRYIEANPLRAGIVRDASQYRWSSFLAHGLGQSDPLLDELGLYQELGREQTTRWTRWQELVHTPLPDAELADLRQCARTGQPYGSEVWVQRMANHMGIPLSLRKRGRPAKGKMI
jgi:putative transposase